MVKEMLKREVREIQWRHVLARAEWERELQESRRIRLLAPLVIRPKSYFSNNRLAGISNGQMVWFFVIAVAGEIELVWLRVRKWLNH